MGWRGFGFVYRSRTLFCRAVPNPNITIRDVFIAVRIPRIPRGELAAGGGSFCRCRISPAVLVPKQLDLGVNINLAAPLRLNFNKILRINNKT